MTIGVDLEILPDEGEPTEGQISVLQCRGILLDDNASFDQAAFAVALMKIGEEAMLSAFGTMPRMACRAVPILYITTDRDVFRIAERAAQRFIKFGQGGKLIRDGAKMGQPVIREWAKSL